MAVELTMDFVERAAELFRAKTAMPRYLFDLLDTKMKSRSFTVAYVESVDRIKQIQDVLVDAIREGQSLHQFRKRAIELIDTTPWHLETVFRTNIQSCYGRATWDRAQILRSLRPYGRYSAIMDGRTRPEHAKLHGLVYPIEHPFWRTYWPPIGYNCRCHVQTMTQWELEQAGITPEVAMPNVHIREDFVSPAIEGIKIDAEKLLAKRGLDPASHMVAHARLSEELASIESRRPPAIEEVEPKKTTGALTDAEYRVQLTKAQENALKFAESCGQVPLSPLEEQVAAKLRQDIDSGSITVCVARKLKADSASYADVYENGRLKNQFELGEKATSSGALDPRKGGERDRWETKIYGGALQKSAEYKQVRNYSNLPQELAMERPIYGYLHTEREYKMSAVSNYGNVIFELRGAVQRTSYTVGDSSERQGKDKKGSLSGGLGPIAKNLARQNLTLQNYVNGTETVDGMKISGPACYIECQILGGVDLNRGDVSRILVYLWPHENESQFEHIKRLGRKYKIPVEIRQIWR